MQFIKFSSTITGMFAIVRIQGKQYKVSPKDTIIVDRMEGEIGATVECTDVLLVSDDKKTSIGTPLVSKKSVKAKILSHGKGEKLDVFRFRAKSRHRRHVGFRASQTTLEILSIE